MMHDHVEILRPHNVAGAVLDLITEAQEYAVLVTAYVRPWENLKQQLARAIERDVAVHVVVRVPDGSKTEKRKTGEALDSLRKYGAIIHEVERLHAKIYINEAQAVVASFNLMEGSLRSVEGGVRLRHPDLVASCHEQIAGFCPTVSREALAKGNRPAADSEFKVGVCIGCGSTDLDYDPAKPLCRACYRKSKRGKELDALGPLACHSCGKAGKTSVEKPLCYECYRRLSATEKRALAGE